MTASKGVRSPVERRSRKRKRALVIDGDMLARIETRLLLEMQGYQVEEVSDGIEAIGLMDLDSPTLDLVVLDYEMPLLNGMETLQALRALSPELKAVLCLKGDENPREDPQEGMAFVCKPLTMQSLTDGMNMACGIRPVPPAPRRAAHSHWMKVHARPPRHLSR